MRVACDNCGAPYKIPDSKLTKEVNKATCKKCGHAMYIRRPDAPEPVADAVAPAEESTLISNPYAAQQAAPVPTPLPSPAAPLAPAAPHVPAGLPPAPLAPAVMPAPPPPVTSPPRAVGGGFNPSWDLPPVPVNPEPTVPEGAVRAPAPARIPYDPSGDLAFAMVGAVMGLLGIALMVVAPLAPALAAAGAFLGTLGVGVALLVLVTGGRGARPASWAASIGGAFVVALAAGGGAVVLSSDSQAPRTPSPATLPAPEPARVAAAPDPALAAAAGAPAPPVSTKPAPVAGPRDEPTARIEPATREPKDAAPEARGETKPTPRAEPKPEPKPDPKPVAKPAPETEDGTSTPPLAAIDTMLKSNKGVRSCFYEARASEGDLPTGVSLKITMQPSGSVTKASIPSGDWAGTDFEGCLVGAVRAIPFPPYDGKSATFTYKFR